MIGVRVLMFRTSGDLRLFRSLANDIGSWEGHAQDIDRNTKRVRE